MYFYESVGGIVSGLVAIATFVALELLIDLGKKWYREMMLRRRLLDRDRGPAAPGDVPVEKAVPDFGDAEAESDPFLEEVTFVE